MSDRRDNVTKNRTSFSLCWHLHIVMTPLILCVLWALSSAAAQIYQLPPPGYPQVPANHQAGQPYSSLSPPSSGPTFLGDPLATMEIFKTARNLVPENHKPIHTEISATAQQQVQVQVPEPTTDDPAPGSLDYFSSLEGSSAPLDAIKDEDR